MITALGEKSEKTRNRTMGYMLADTLHVSQGLGGKSVSNPDIYFDCGTSITWQTRREKKIFPSSTIEGRVLGPVRAKEASAKYRMAGTRTKKPFKR